MSLFLIFLIGLFGLLLLLFLKNPILNMVNKNNNIVIKLRNAKWFQNHWLSGIFLFLMNAFLFSITVFLLYVFMYFSIPFVHLLLICVAVIGSIFLWVSINKAWQGNKVNRLKLGAVGSCFYVFLTLMFVSWLVTLRPSYPGEDTFMAAIGLMFAIMATTFACITCFVITGFSEKQDRTIHFLND